MTEITNQFGVKYDREGNTFQINKYFTDSNVAAQIAREFYAENPDTTNVRVVSATELELFEEKAPETIKTTPKK